MKKATYLLFIAFLIAVSNINAQPGVFTPGDYRDGIYDKENKDEGQKLPDKMIAHSLCSPIATFNNMEYIQIMI